MSTASPFGPAHTADFDNGPVSAVERLLTLKDIATQLGLPEFKVTRAAKAGAFPTYTLYNKRKLARLSEVVAAIESSRAGGDR